MHAPEARRIVVREVLRQVLAYAVIVLLATLVGAFATLAPAVFAIGAGTGAGVAVLIEAFEQAQATAQRCWDEYDAVTR